MIYLCVVVLVHGLQLVAVYFVFRIKNNSNKVSRSARSGSEKLLHNYYFYINVKTVMLLRVYLMEILLYRAKRNLRLHENVQWTNTRFSFFVYSFDAF